MFQLLVVILKKTDRVFEVGGEKWDTEFFNSRYLEISFHFQKFPLPTSKNRYLL